MNLDDIRKMIDEDDEKIVELFEHRMSLSAEVAEYKAKHNLPVLNSKRERDIIARLSAIAKEDHASYIRVLYSLIFELSRSYQGKLMDKNSELYDKIAEAIENTDRQFPKSAYVACQGIEGAYSQLACERLFNSPSIMYFDSFDSVFSAVEKGLCRYGIIPIENSTAGSVKKVYDLMVKHNFFIVRSVRARIDHCLLAKSGAKLSDIKEVYTHEQAVSQCAEYLGKLNVKITYCENTAVAAKLAAQSDRTDVAAVCSRECSVLYGLEILGECVNDMGNNTTRFICISKNIEIYPGADKTSIMMVLPHKPGSLYKALARLYALDINLIKLESRPLPQRDFEFMFYFDFETSVYSQEFAQLMCELDSVCEEFKYLGSYSEMV